MCAYLKRCGRGNHAAECPGGRRLILRLTDRLQSIARFGSYQVLPHLSPRPKMSVAKNVLETGNRHTIAISRTFLVDSWRSAWQCVLCDSSVDVHLCFIITNKWQIEEANMASTLTPSEQTCSYQRRSVIWTLIARNPALQPAPCNWPYVERKRCVPPLLFHPSKLNNMF